ncbi:MAG TPA: GxxExxY protein [Gemmatimonadales bacterium]|nr:GxxExxY protein [Gemmatimonadales bacterium]
MLKSLETDHLTRDVVGAAIDVHRNLGPGLLESAYQACMEVELRLRQLPFQAEVALPLEYKGHLIDAAAYRPDLIVDDRIVVELKAVSALLPIHSAQLLTYMRLLKCRVGLLINFNVPAIRHGIRRLLND